jgi:hypothetical protein
MSAARHPELSRFLIVVKCVVTEHSEGWTHQQRYRLHVSQSTKALALKRPIRLVLIALPSFLTIIRSADVENPTRLLAYYPPLITLSTPRLTQYRVHSTYCSSRKTTLPFTFRAHFSHMLASTCSTHQIQQVT